MLNSFVYTLFVWSPYFLAFLILLILLRRFMPSWVKMWLIKLIAGLMIATYAVGLLHYTLPQRDIVRVLDADVKRMDINKSAMFWSQPDSGTVANETRDVRFIETAFPDGTVMVFRNEDTGFSWPPYFKFDSSNVGAEAKLLVSTQTEPRWVAVRHYGWRNSLFTIFPNATSIKEVSGPDVRLIPWFNIIFFAILALVLLGIFRLMQRFKRNRIDPMVDSVEDAWDDVSAGTQSFGDRIRGFFKRWGG